METFIVRIYRRVTGDLDEPAGTVEDVRSGERFGFSDARQLIARLLRRDAEVRMSAGDGRKGGKREGGSSDAP